MILQVLRKWCSIVVTVSVSQVIMIINISYLKNNRHMQIMGMILDQVLNRRIIIIIDFRFRENFLLQKVEVMLKCCCTVKIRMS